MDALDVQYARELSRWDIETSIIVPGAFTRGTNYLAHAGRPADQARVAEYEAAHMRVSRSRSKMLFERTVPEDADPGRVAGAIACVIDTPCGERPFGVHIDPTADGAAVAFAVIDRVRNEMLKRVGFLT